MCKHNSHHLLRRSVLPQKGDLCRRHINNRALIKALLCTKGKKCKIYGQPEALPGLIPQFWGLCVITMGKLRLFYVPDHLVDFLKGRKKKMGRENVFTVFLFLVF